MKVVNVYKARAVACAVVAASLLLLLAFQYWFAYTDPAEIRLTTLRAKTTETPEINFVFSKQPRRLADIEFLNGEKQKRRIAELQGKLVLLNIWATWCIPCRQEMPAFDRLQTKLGRRNMKILALSIDRNGLDDVRAFYKKFRLEALDIWVNVSSQLTRDLSLVGIPTTLLLDRKGREVARLIGPAVWDIPEMISFLRAQISKVNSAALSVDN